MIKVKNLKKYFPITGGFFNNKLGNVKAVENVTFEIPEGESPELMHKKADKVEKLLAVEMNANVVTHVDPVTVEGEEYEKMQGIILKNLQAMNLPETIQHLRVVKTKEVESILFQVPVSVEFYQKEEFKTKCKQELQQMFPDSNVMIEFKSQMSLG